MLIYTQHCFSIRVFIWCVVFSYFLVQVLKITEIFSYENASRGLCVCIWTKLYVYYFLFHDIISWVEKQIYVRSVYCMLCFSSLLASFKNFILCWRCAHLSYKSFSLKLEYKQMSFVYYVLFVVMFKRIILHYKVCTALLHCWYMLCYKGKTYVIVIILLSLFSLLFRGTNIW